MKPTFKFISSYTSACFIISIFIFSHQVLAVNQKSQWLNLSDSEYIKQRLECEKNLQDIKWFHNIWDTQNNRPKPKRSEIISNKHLEVNIEESLKMEMALLNIFEIPISQKLLQAELNRITNTTTDPKRLQEIFDALNNDPQTIAECVARPLLVSNLLYKNINKTDTNSNFDLWWQTQADFWDDYQQSEKSSVLYLQDISTKESLIYRGGFTIPEARDNHVAVWTGNSMLIWGGSNNDNNDLSSGASYNPSSGIWQEIATLNEPAARSYTSAIWTGNEMIVWGGLLNNIAYLGTGGRYNPVTNSWVPVQSSGAPVARYTHTAVWTGSDMIVWGGYANNTLNTGGRYNVLTNSWSPTSLTNAADARSFHTAIWTGSEMIVWGGNNQNSVKSTGSKYDPVNDTWTSTSTVNIPASRYRHSAIWTGSEMIVWGGSVIPLSFYNNGGKYNPTLDSWTPVAAFSLGRIYHSAVWTGSEMLIWGRYDSNTGARYEPTTASWQAMSTENTPPNRDGQSTVWTGTQMIIWGGRSASATLNSLGIYSATSNLWVVDLIFKNNFESPSFK